MALLVYITGVCGVGKSAVGRALADALEAPFVEGDEYHPPANVEKMRAGTPLDDDDRWPWLRALAQAGGDAARASDAGVAVCACSGLKRAYRDLLADAAGCDTFTVLLHGERELIAARMAARSGHFMPTTLLDSQLATLQLPADDEDAMIADVAAPVDALTAALLDTVRARL